MPGRATSPPTREVREQARAEVAGRVDRVARVRAEGHPDRRHDQPDHQRPEVGLYCGVARIDHRDDEHEQEGGADDLIDERTDPPAVEVRRRERREDRERDVALGARPRGTQRGVERVDRVAVDEEDQRGPHERAEHLRDYVRPDLVPRETSPDGEGERDGRVDVGAAHAARHVDREGHGHGPSPGDEQPVPGGEEDGRRCLGAARARQPGNSHGDDAVTERDQDERAEELREELAPRAAESLEPVPA